MVTGNELSSRGKCTVSWQVFKNMPSLMEISLREFTKIHGNFMCPISPYFEVLMCYIIVYKREMFSSSTDVIYR